MGAEDEWVAGRAEGVEMEVARRVALGWVVLGYHGQGLGGEID